MARPQSAGSNPVRVRFAEFELDEANATLLRDGKPLALAPTPFALLCALARQPSTLLTKDALLDEVWGHQFVSESVLKTAVSDLRTALGDDPRLPRLIQTVPRRGYKFIATAIAVGARSGPPLAQADTGGQEPSSFVGRADAVARLGAAWERAYGGTRSLVWVTGEPGIGKTTLIEHFIAGLRDVACARGQCVEHYGTGEPYLPVLEALADLCRRDNALPALLRAVAPTWLLQLPWLSTTQEREALRRELSGVGPERMLREMGELLDRYTGERPLLLVTEDLHWSDRSTLHLIDYIGRRRGGSRLMWLASFRLAEVVALDHPLNPLRHELRLHRLCEEIVLDPFSEREIADYVAAATPALAADVAFVRGLHERTDGVPLFVASVMADLSVHTASSGDAAVARALLADVAVPENLAAIIDHYIARLGSDERALLSTAAICGMDFRAETIAEAIERDPAWVAETCEQLSRARVWVAAPHAAQPAGGAERAYTFRHTLFRQVLYERTAAAARAQLHRKVGAALERERGRGGSVPAAQLAMHFDRGREPMTALRYYAEAAEAALRGLSAEECMMLTERALGLLDSASAGAERSSLEIMLCTVRGMAAFRLLGVGPESKNAYRRAYALLPDVPEHRARELLTHGYGFVLCQRAEYDEALAVAENAAAHAGKAGVPLLLVTASNVEGQVHMMQGRPRAARTRLERALPAIAAADPGADRQVAVVPQVMLLALLAVQLFHLGLVRQARDRLQEARLRAQEVNVPMARLVVMWIDALLEVRLGHADRVSALADEMRALVEESALVQGGAASEWFHGWAEARRGNAREGHRRIRAAYERNTALGMLAGGSEVLGYAAEALVLAGDLEGADRELRHALEVAHAQEERIYLPQLYLTEAAIARARRNPESAEAAVRRALAEAREQEAPWHVLLALVELCEHGKAEAADRDALATVLEQLPEAADTAVAAKARALL